MLLLILRTPTQQRKPPSLLTPSCPAAINIKLVIIKSASSLSTIEISTNMRHLSTKPLDGLRSKDMEVSANILRLSQRPRLVSVFETSYVFHKTTQLLMRAKRILHMSP